MEKIKELFSNLILPLFTEKNADGKSKVSIGRAPLLMVLLTMCWHYAIKNEGPPEGILIFIATAMAYNGFKKTKGASGQLPPPPNPMVNDDDGEGD